jgi:hypothetical protein
VSRQSRRMAFGFPSVKPNRSREAIHRLQILLQLESECRVGPRRVYEIYLARGTTLTRIFIAS